MTDTSSVLDDLMGDGDSYYDPDLDFTGLVPKGVYKAHISGLSVKRDVVIRNVNLADIYEFDVTLAADNESEMFGDGDKTVSGKALAGITLKSKGVFRFKKPNEPTLSDNPGGNRQYKELLEALNVPITEKDGKYKLTEIDESIVGKPVIANVFHDTWVSKRDGKEHTTAKVYNFSRWNASEELPF